MAHLLPFYAYFFALKWNFLFLSIRLPSGMKTAKKVDLYAALSNFKRVGLMKCTVIIAVEYMRIHLLTRFKKC